ncbi:probable ribonuclease ZC3H12B isoform X2 [Littorina saxatilis]|uniref:probable ribonuclease ZC3H12B isoform X2 n=1 Tax=Littorina saxatilis TaxID=31220 RepID=UPI0038B58907
MYIEVYLKAVLEESSDFTIARHSLSHEEFEMVRKNSDAIERRHLIVLDLSRLELCMKGRGLHVQAARQQVQQLIMGQQSADPMDHGLTQSAVASSDFHLQQGEDFSVRKVPVCDKDSGVEVREKSFGDQPFSPSFRDADNNLISGPSHSDPMRSYSLTTDAEQEQYLSVCTSDFDLTPRGSSAGFGRTFAQVASAADARFGVDAVKDPRTGVISEVDFQEAESGRSSSSSSDEDSGVGVMDKRDPRYNAWLTYAIKLGYIEADLDRVIGRHGLDCDENQMLHELIEGSAGSGNAESEDFFEGGFSVSEPPPDFASTESELLKSVREKVSKSAEDSSSNLRHIVIDGSNVAMSHGKNVFSCQGIRIAVDWFRQRGHKEITVFVPQWRKETSRPDTPITDQSILTDLEKQGIVVFTPARRIKGRRVVCYDDRFVLKLAADTNGIVVSNDNYRDLLNEDQEYRKVVDERLLMYTFVNDRFMPPEDPLGRRGPTLDNFLCKEPTSPPTLPPECPYGRKCTYGNKCKYYHPERGSQPHKTVTEALREQATIKMQERAAKGPEQDKSRKPKPKLTRTRSLAPGEPLPSEKISPVSPLPSGLKEPDSDPATSRVKSPTRGTSKTSDYLREHRRKLEEALAKVSLSDAAPVVPPPEPGPISSPREALSPLPAMGSRVSSPSRLNVPFTSSQEGSLVSGHLLLAKKLSDEGSDTNFFNPKTSSNRASPVMLAGPAGSGIGHHDSAQFNSLFDRRPSLQDHHFQTQLQNQQQYYTQPPHLLARDSESASGTCVSGPARYHQDPAYQVQGMGSHCQSFPIMEKDSGRRALHRGYSEHPPSALSMAGSMSMEGGSREHTPLKPQHSVPSQFPPTPGTFQGRPFKGMMRQNSSSDTQLYMAGSGDGTLPSHVSVPSFSGLDARGPQSVHSQAEPHSMQQHQHGLSRSTSVQPFPHQQSFIGPMGLDRQCSEVVYSTQDRAAHTMHPYPQQWDMGSMYHSHPASPHYHPHPHLPATPSTHQPPPPFIGSGVPQWQHNPMQRRSFPAEQPIPPSDPRYSLYYHLCSIFAEHRVRAVMNKYPDETDPQKICASIMNTL